MDWYKIYWKLPDAAVVRRDRKPHHDRDFSVLSAGDPDFDGIYARSAAKENESGAIKYRCSCIWKNAQEQRYFCTHHPAPAPEQPAAMHTIMVLGVALGWRTPLLKSGLLGLSCLYAAAGILLHKLDDHRRQGDKEDDTDDAKELSTDHSGNKGVQRRKSHGLSHHPGVDELVFNKLNDLIYDNAQQPLPRIYHYNEQCSNKAGSKCSNVWNKGKDCCQYGNQVCVWQAEYGKCNEY